MALAWRRTARRLRVSPANSRLTRLRRGSLAMAAFTAPVLAAFAADAVAAGAPAGGLVSGRFLLTLLAYVPWALVQQTLFLVYLLARLRALAPSASPLALAAVNGLAYGAVHVPEWDVALLTVAGGIVWSYAYLRDRALLPVALSHALLGSAYFHWIRGLEPVRLFSGLP